ncbi:unnamed protein product [Ambrosiozyma monospora]|uniref:Unnamed protein product n=1 Tax=Ambrosiozyma monospora TaxID=43982 RepID=A0A9W6YQP6_AMBMO|nr:unnamed protein product [Ambrosiozyma monospora]
MAVSAIKNNNGNKNNGNDGKKKKGARHGGGYPKSKKNVKQDKYIMTCYNCGKEGHSLFDAHCPNHKEVEALLANGTSMKDIINKFRKAFDKRTVSSIHFCHNNIPTAPASMIDEHEVLDSASEGFKTITINPAPGASGAPYEIRYHASQRNLYKENNKDIQTSEKSNPSNFSSSSTESNCASDSASVTSFVCPSISRSGALPVSVPCSKTVGSVVSDVFKPKLYTAAGVTITGNLSMLHDYVKFDPETSNHFTTNTTAVG